MKRIFLVFTLIMSVFALNAAELFYDDGTSIPIKKSEDLRAVKTDVQDSSNRKDAVYSMNTGRYVYSFVSGRKGGDGFPVYFLGETPVVAERTVFWRGEKSVEYMEEKYEMKLVEIFSDYQLHSFSVKGDSVEIAGKIVKNGDGYAFPDLVRETTINFIPESYPSDPYFERQWHLHNTGTATFHYGNADLDRPVVANADTKFIQMLEFLHSNNIPVDTNTKIAIMDTGVAPNHEDLTNLDVGWDAVENKEGGYPNEVFINGDDHGTMCAGVSAGVGNDIGMSGMCPWCRIYPLRWISGKTSSHSSSDMLAVYEKYLADPDITTINCSFGPSPKDGISYIYPDTITAIRSFMQNGRNGKGGVVVYSSGNDNVDSVYNRLLEYDFKFKRNGVEVTDRVVTVNASTAWDTKAEYSNFGYSSTVSAPSLSRGPQVGIATATIPGHGEYPADGGDYTRLFSGTSAAAPVVSGLFGVIFSVNPDLTLEEAIEILKQSADKINPETGFWDDSGFSVKYGYGRVNLEKAVRLTKGLEMCAEQKAEECGNHIDDDCDGYVDEGCSSTLPAGKSCTKDSDCVGGPWKASDVKCLTSREAWVFNGGYCFVKSVLYVNPVTYSFAPCPDGTTILGEREGYDNYCALECNSEHPCQREGYYCTDEVLGICVPLCSSDSDCTEGYSCSNSGHCTSACGNGRIDDGEECDNGDDNGITYCAYGETSCSVCTAACKIAAGTTSYCGDWKTDPLNGEGCDKGSYYNGRMECSYGETSCTVCTSDCQEAAGKTSYCGDGITDTYNNREKCDNGADNGITDCAYGETSCTVCTEACKTAAGITSYCGDGRLDETNKEKCDNGADNGRTNCAYGETSCSVCTAACKIAAGETSYCGDGNTDEANGESCDDASENGKYDRCNSTCNGLAAHCGDGNIDSANGEVCDNGDDNGKTNCVYGETSCELCTTQCQKIAGATSFCGDGTVDATNGEACDSGADNGRTNCAYGETACELCTTQCQKIAGITSYCGDGTLDATNNEACDNGSDNGRTNCAYGETECSVCTSACKVAAGATSYCGDGTLDATNNEACDNGTDNGRTNCAYGETACELCTNQCQKIAGATSFCGDGTVDASNNEACDSGTDNGRTNCAYGETACELCTTQCQKIAGSTSFCGDGRIDEANGEECDDPSINGQTACAYGETECSVCTSACKVAAGTTSYCGDGTVDAVNNEACDNGFGNGETNCLYGETACTVCTTDCRETSGATSFCGDGIIDSENGEICDEGEENGEIDHCNSTCSGIVVEIPDDTPDEDIPDDDNPDEDAPDSDEISDIDDNQDDDVSDIDEPADNDETADEDEISDNGGENSDSSENSDEGETSNDNEISSDEDPAETDNSSETTVSDDDNAATDDGKKSGGCTLLVI